MKKVIILFLLGFTSIEVFAQEPTSKVDSIQINKVNKSIDYMLHNEQRDKQYVVFCYGESIVYVAKHGTNYKLLKGRMQFNFKTQQMETVNIKLENLVNIKQLNKCFEMSVCDPSKAFTASDTLKRDYINPDSGYIYFTIKNGSEFPCEFNIPITYDATPKYKRPAIPLEKDVFGFFLKQIWGN